MDPVQVVLQLGAVGVFLLVFGAILRGDLRTKFEVESWRTRADTAEATIREMAVTNRETAKSLDRLTESVERHLLGGR